MSTPLMADKKATLGDDLISALVVAQQDDHLVSTEELRNLIVTLVFAAFTDRRCPDCASELRRYVAYMSVTVPGVDHDRLLG